MSWQVAVALIIAVPVVLLPVAFVWYLNTGGVLAAVREMRARRRAQSTQAEVVSSTEK